MHTIGGLIVVNSHTKLKSANTIYLLPYRLRLIRTAFGDNGFRGVRAVTSSVQFLKDLRTEQQSNKEAGDYPEDPSAPEDGSPNAVFDEIEEGQYMTISPKNSLKYLVCNPQHRWALAIKDNIIFLYSLSAAAAKKQFKATQIVEVNGIGCFI